MIPSVKRGKADVLVEFGLGQQAGGLIAHAADEQLAAVKQLVQKTVHITYARSWRPKH